MTRFENRTCIVTGGARGIGAETARGFVAQGGNVLIGDVNDANGAAVADELGDDCAAFMHLDVSDPAACKAAVDLAVERFGSVDCVVNSAVKMAPAALKDLSLDDWNTMVQIGLTGSFLMSQAAGRWMIDHGRKGSMIMISSIGGRNPYGMSGAYSTVKAGLIMLAKHLAIEWAEHGIRVNSVCPGHTETPLTAYLQDPEIKQARSEVTPLKRVGQPKDIADGILFLLSDEADYVTAAVLDIDGGLTSSVMNHMPGRKWS